MILTVPCLTLRENTERPVTCTLGSNRLEGTKPKPNIAAYHDAVNDRKRTSQIPPLWDGRAAGRIPWIVIEQENPMCLKVTKE